MSKFSLVQTQGDNLCRCCELAAFRVDIESTLDQIRDPAWLVRCANATQEHMIGKETYGIMVQRKAKQRAERPESGNFQSITSVADVPCVVSTPSRQQ